jgi:hypothetical protein
MPGAKPGSLPPETIEGLGYVYGPGLIPIAVIGLIAISTYRIDKQRHADILSSIREKADGTDSALRSLAPLTPAEQIAEMGPQQVK